MMASLLSLSSSWIHSSWKEKNRLKNVKKIKTFIIIVVHSNMLQDIKTQDEQGTINNLDLNNSWSLIILIDLCPNECQIQILKYRNYTFEFCWENFKTECSNEMPTYWWSFALKISFYIWWNIQWKWSS